MGPKCHYANYARNSFKKLNPIAQEYGFKVYGSVPTQKKAGSKIADFSKTLSTPLRVQFSDSEEITKSIPIVAEHAKLSRLHNDANVLALGSRLTDEKDIYAIIDIFLATPFEGGRHSDRIKKIDYI